MVSSLIIQWLILLIHEFISFHDTIYALICVGKSNSSKKLL